MKLPIASSNKLEFSSVDPLTLELVQGSPRLIITQQSSVIKGRSHSSIRVREWLVAISSGATLAFTAWGLGGVQMWTLNVLLIGGLFTLSSAVINVRFSKFPFFCLSNQTLHRLILWPPFWFSFLFLLYLLIGALNPAAEVVRDERGWWVEALQAPLASWLPTSVRSNYQPMNAWRVLANFTAAFTLIWGLWAGLTRRKAVLLVLWSLLVSGALMALVGILQYMTHADKVLWAFPSSNQHFWGSFFYRNQGVAFLNLILVDAGLPFFTTQLRHVSVFVRVARIFSVFFSLLGWRPPSDWRFRGEEFW